MGNGTNANPDETLMIADLGFRFQMRQELFHHANRPVQIDFNLLSDVFKASSFVVNIDLTHDASVVDQDIELRKLFGDIFVESGNCFRIGNGASKGMNLWKGS